MKKPTTDFGRELRNLRKKEAGISQKELATLAGISIGYLSMLETGGKRPTDRVIRRLSRVFEIDPNHLFRTVNKVEMDLVSTLINKRDEIHNKMPDLPSKHLEEIANYLTYLEFKAIIID